MNSENDLIASSDHGHQYRSKDVNDIFKMINLFNELERNEVDVSGYGWSLIYKRYGLSGIIELDKASGWICIQEGQLYLNDFLEVLLSSGYNPVTGLFGELQKDTFLDRDGKKYELNQIYETFRTNNKDILQNPTIEKRPLPKCQLDCSFEEGDVLAKRYDGFWTLRKVLKIDHFELNEGDKVMIQGITFTASKNDSITVVSISHCGKSYKDMREVKRAVKYKNWYRNIEHIPLRVSMLENFKIVTNQSVSEDELNAYNHWIKKCEDRLIRVY